MGRVADTRYRTYPWDAPKGTRGAYETPFGSSEYAGVTDAIDTVTATHDELAMRGAAYQPQPELPYSRTAPGIRDILSNARLYPDQSRSLSGTEAGYTGSPRNEYGGSVGG
jgi:hypothetical protein